MDRDTEAQLTVIREIADLLDHAHIRFWLRGGWALDFHAGRVTGDHGDIDVVARFRQRARIRRLLEANGYLVERVADLASVHFSKRGQDISLAFIWTDEMARAVTPGREFWPWADGAFTDRRYTLEGITCRAMSLECLLGEKETYAQYSGRPLREKDIESIRMLRILMEREPARVGAFN